MSGIHKVRLYAMVSWYGFGLFFDDFHWQSLLGR